MVGFPGVLRAAIGWIGMVGCCVVSADDGPMREGLSRVARQAAVEAAEAMRFEFDDSRFRGSVSPIAPDAELEVDIQAFVLTEDQITADLRVALPLAVRGQIRLAAEAEPLEIDARVRVRVSTQADAPLRLEGTSVVLKPQMTQISATFEVEKLEPETLVSAEQLTLLLNGLFEPHQAEVTRRVNQTLDAHPIGQLAFFGDDRQDNPLLRSLLSRAIHERLAEHHDRESGWHVDDRPDGSTRLSVEKDCWFWLDDPERHLVVSVPKFALRDGELSFRAEARGRIAARIHARFVILRRKLRDERVSVKAHAEVAIEGTCRIGATGLEAVKIHDLSTQVRDLRSPAVLIDLLRCWAEDAINHGLRTQHVALKQQLAEAIGQLKW